MTSNHIGKVHRRLLTRGYVPTVEAQERLKQFKAAGVIEYRLAKALGVPSSDLTRLRLGRNKLMPGGLSRRILDIAVEEAVRLYTRRAPVLDPHILNQILAGHTITLPSHNKPLYVQALHERGWTKNRITYTLGVSGATINKILAQVVA